MVETNKERITKMTEVLDVKLEGLFNDAVRQVLRFIRKEQTEDEMKGEIASLNKYGVELIHRALEKISQPPKYEFDDSRLVYLWEHHESFNELRKTLDKVVHAHRAEAVKQIEKKITDILDGMEDKTARNVVLFHLHEESNPPISHQVKEPDQSLTAIE